MIKGVILDLDGTLIDSLGMWYDIDRKFLAENGVTNPPEGISWKIKQMTIETASQFMINEFGIKMTPQQVIKRIEELASDEYKYNLVLKKGAADLLDYLNKNGIPCGVATATYKELAVAVLKRCGVLERMSFILTDKEYPNGKGFPDIFLGAAKMLGTDPTETLVVEDSIHCIETAAKAGFITAAVFDKTAESEWESVKEIASYSCLELGDIKMIIEDFKNE